MSDAPIDPERIAALLDGRLDAREREALLAELAQSESDVDALADTAAVLRELEQPVGERRGDVPAPALQVIRGDAPEPPARPSMTTRPTSPFRRWTIAAAAALALVAAGLWSRGRSTAPATPVTLVAALDASRGTGAPTLPPIDWSRTRGAGDALTPEARAIRFGATFAQLTLAARTRDTAATRSLAHDAARLLDAAAGAGAMATAVDALGDVATQDSAVVTTRLAAAWDAAITVLDARDASLGAWLATARTAIARQDAAFLTNPASANAAKTLESRARDDPDAAASARRLAASTAADAIAPDWPALARDVDTLLTRLGR